MKKKTHNTQVRIIGGTWKRSVIDFAAIDGLRPTMDRVRETLFNWLQPYCPGAHCLDLYAGSGALGIEALSRGAKHVSFVEQNRQAAQVLKSNLQRLGATHFDIQQRDALSLLNTSAPHPIDIIFVDPPFHKELISQSYQALDSWPSVTDSTLIYIEAEHHTNIEKTCRKWSVVKHGQAGKTQFFLFKKS